MPSAKTSSESTNPLTGQDETIGFLKRHLPMKAIMAATRERFAEIHDLLLREQINRHDRSHQLRTAVNAVKAMRLMGFDHREVMQAAAGALVHDVGYNRPDDAKPETKADDYHAGNRAKFKKHALYGAEEVRGRLTRILEVLRQRNGRPAELQELVSYKDEEGGTQRMDEHDIEQIAEIILNHNDYGKDEKDYDPRGVGKAALMVQMFDKLDICRQRVYPEHMKPSAFVATSERVDPKYFHRTVPFCVRHYDFTIDREEGALKMDYQVDFEEFRELMRGSYPDFEYTKEEFVCDFQRAYGQNCQIAAEAMEVVTDKATTRPTLIVALRFRDGTTKELSYSRPNRTIYNKKPETLKVSMRNYLQTRLAQL